MHLSVNNAEKLKGDFQICRAEVYKNHIFLLKERTDLTKLSKFRKKPNYTSVPDSAGYFGLGKFNRVEH